MKRCSCCLIPHIRPEQIISKEGICDACLNFRLKDGIDWSLRKLEFDQLLNKLKIKKKVNKYRDLKFIYAIIKLFY